MLAIEYGGMGRHVALLDTETTSTFLTVSRIVDSHFCVAKL